MSTVVPGNCARFAAAPIADGGTPVTEWLAWQPDFPALRLDRCPGLVVVAAHPDDETLGFGAAASDIAAHDIEVHTVIASDGGMAWPDLSAWEQDRLQESRRHESQCAADLLGLPRPSFLGLPDGGLAAHESHLADILTDILTACGAGMWCAAPWRGDGHPDHEAAGRAAAIAARRTGAVLMEYPIWMWHWAHPDDADVPWNRAVRPSSEPVAALRKRQAIDAFRSQLHPQASDRDAILPPFVVSRIDQIGEVVFR
ncbi:LmbE family N-acetylglucosaminyl deacetylase [Mycolicibacterium sp. BK556]|uniref:PIG-L deacetylase family protein n=1 Tax=unclassified Mycolicibacterium TaxID=2636767 RepID=UPI00161630DD|nr:MULTISPECIES: PIG-L family deacetylase [unclassified Mycolicibacterium]MBB3604414.1 LmbE family N-acetylglucosaminyl deacetylase [Mycolicibacterium sp. BK556]MBB3634873.1 LmbE family N-acetylglucosaminyl deacetylase [Mycolicibacterium sp. BK607]